MKDFQQVCRGQVWWVDEDREQAQMRIKDKNDHVQAKGRPWLIISCEENNTYSPVVNCVCIATGNKDSYPMHVFFQYQGRPQNVQCEQLRTFNITDLEKYMYTLTPDFMAKVDVAVANQLGLQLSLPSYEAIASLVDKIAEYKAKEIKATYLQASDEVVAEIVSRIERHFEFDEGLVKGGGPVKELLHKLTENDSKLVEYKGNITDEQYEQFHDVPTPVVEQPKPQPVEQPKPQPVEQPKPQPVEQPKPQPTNRGTKGKSRRKMWDAIKMKEFLSDCDTMSPTDVAVKWGLKDKKTVFVYKSSFKNLVGKNHGNDGETTAVS